MISRRSLFGWIAGLVAAPIVPVADAEFIKAFKQHVLNQGWGRKRVPSPAEWLKYSQSFAQTNSLGVFVQNKFDEEFGKGGTKVGQTLRIKLPTDYRVL